MAYGLIYNLNFASNIGDRKHLLSIYKDGHTATITTNDNNIIGTEEPVVVIWDNTDDIYNNIMGSRLEINLYSDAVKQIDVADILAGTQVNRYKVLYSKENSSGVLVPYWEGYISNASFEEGISSTPKPYKIIATDLLSTFKNILTTDGTAVVDSAETVIKYVDNLIGFLPQFYNYKISNNIQVKPYSTYPDYTTVFKKFHLLQWVSACSSGLNLAYDNAYDYLQSTLKAFNARMFYANSYWYIINNSSYEDTPEFDYFNTSGVYSSTGSENVVKTIPTNLKPLGDNLSLRYDTPYDVVEVIANNSPYATNFDIELVDTIINNLSPYPSFETKVNGILFNDTFYSDNYIASQMSDAYVKAGNYSIKTKTFISSGTPTQKILDTGFQGDFQLTPRVFSGESVPMYFHASFYLSLSGSDSFNITVYYSLLREVASSSTGPTISRSYYNGSTWVNYTNEADATKLSYNVPEAGVDSWTEIAVPIQTTGTLTFARYRVILWRPKKIGLGNPHIHFDQVFIGRNATVNFGDRVRTRARLSGSTRRNKKLTYEFNSFYPINRFGTFVKTDTIEPLYLAQLNEVISQQILNDNRTHLKRYSVTTTPVNNDIIFPYHKININFVNYTSNAACIIDRMRYRAKSNVYELEFHEPNQATNVNIDFDLIQ